MKLRRYVGLFAQQARVSALLLMQYRADFIVGLVLSAFWTSSALVPLFVLFGDRQSVLGWTWAEALLVVGWFNLLKGVQSAIIQPSMQLAVEHVRKGTLDFVLIKPADAQFLVSCGRFDFNRLSDTVVGVAILAFGLAHLGRLPSPLAFLQTILLFVCAVAILYSIWVMVMSLAFLFVKVDNLTYLFSSIYDVARWPSSVFRGVFSFVFTFVLPLALMTTYPALALLERIASSQIAGAVGGAVFFLTASRMVWKAAIARYTSAGG